MTNSNERTLTAAPSSKVEVGFNYPWPWNKYGIYFGSSDPALNMWVDTLKANLTLLQAILRIEKVRIFLLCNAATLGTCTWRSMTVPEVPTIDNKIQRTESWWEYQAPETLDEKYKEHLRGMLGAFETRGMQVIPSLVDFGAIIHVKEKPSRKEIVTLASKRAHFLDTVFEPLLRVSEEFKKTVYAWEVMNEPVWVTSDIRALAAKFTESPVATSEMSQFLTEGLARIEAHGFASTIGHRFSNDMSTFPTGTIPQFHYYPNAGWHGIQAERALPSFKETNAILGEFASERIPPASKVGTVWPDIDPALQESPKSRVFARLRHIEQKGYRLAFIWPDLGGDRIPPGPTDELKLSPGVQEGIRAYQDT